MATTTMTEILRQSVSDELSQRRAARLMNRSKSSMGRMLQSGHMCIDELPQLLAHLDTTVGMRIAAQMTPLVPPVLDGPEVCQQSSTAVVRTHEELLEAQQAMHTVARLMSRVRLDDEERSELEQALLELIEGMTAITHLCLSARERHDIDLQALMARHRQELAAKGYVERG